MLSDQFSRSRSDPELPGGDRPQLGAAGQDQVEEEPREPRRDAGVAGWAAAGLPTAGLPCLDAHVVLRVFTVFIVPVLSCIDGN